MSMAHDTIKIKYRMLIVVYKVIKPTICTGRTM